MKKLIARLAGQAVLVMALLLMTTACGTFPSTRQTLAPTPRGAAVQTVLPGLDNRALDKAELALRSFFTALNAGHYSEAVALFGGDYEVLRDWNPTIAPDDHEKLLESGCAVNGLRCLKVKHVIEEVQISPTKFRFLVEFMNPDGTLFKRVPCCGAGEDVQSTVTQFEYIVVGSGDRFTVQELPVYAP